MLGGGRVWLERVVAGGGDVELKPCAETLVCEEKCWVIGTCASCCMVHATVDKQTRPHSVGLTTHQTPLLLLEYALFWSIASENRSRLSSLPRNTAETTSTLQQVCKSVGMTCGNESTVMRCFQTLAGMAMAACEIGRTA